MSPLHDVPKPPSAGVWEKPEPSMRYDLLGGYLVSVTGLYNEGTTIGGLIYHTDRKSVV